MGREVRQVDQVSALLQIPETLVLFSVVQLHAPPNANAWHLVHVH